MSFTCISFCVLGFACLEYVWHVLDSLVKSFDFTFKIFFKEMCKTGFKMTIWPTVCIEVSGISQCAERGPSMSKCLMYLVFQS